MEKYCLWLVVYVLWDLPCRHNVLDKYTDRASSWRISCFSLNIIIQVIGFISLCKSLFHENLHPHFMPPTSMFLLEIEEHNNSFLLPQRYLI